MRYITLLRGINVGGHKKVPMAELRELFGSWSFENAKTLLNSGNIAFDTKETGEEKLVREIETRFTKAFGFASKVMLRKIPDIKGLITLDPFKKITVDNDTRLYVTFLRKAAESRLKLPYTSEQNDFQIIGKTEREVFSVLTLKTARSVDAMAFLEKEFGKDITTRNWNTVLKIADL